MSRPEDVLEALRAKRDEAREVAEAAPDMLRALRMVIREFETTEVCMSERRALDAAVAAVRKATGVRA